MKTRVSMVTSFNKKGYDQYGRRMMDTFNKFVEIGIPIYVYYEDFKPIADLNRFQFVDLLKSCPDLVAFKERHKDNETANGIVEVEGFTQKKYRMQWDAVKFSHKAYALAHALEHVDTDILIWVDADVFAHAPASKEFILSFLPEGNYCSYLGRERKDTETGWIMFDKRMVVSNNRFRERYKEYYDSDLVFSIEKWIDGLVFDHVRHDTAVIGYNISGDYAGVHHPFIACDLKQSFDHLKGFARKDRGSSTFDKDKPLWNL